MNKRQILLIDKMRELRWQMTFVARRRTLKTVAGSTKIVLPKRGKFPSFYIFALHKSGSTLLNNMLKEALALAQIPVLALPEIAFLAGLPENDILNPEAFIFDTGYCYRGFREFPSYLRAFDLSRHKKVLLIRDPRDMLVSNFFSVRSSHLLPGSGAVHLSLIKERELAKAMDVDSYCQLWSQYFRLEFEGYRHLLGTNIRVFRYEDVIFNKRRWLEEMLTYLNVSIPSREIVAIAQANEILPEQERPDQHVRQVKPGNFRKHLTLETIGHLNSEFSNILSSFGYAQ